MVTEATDLGARIAVADIAGMLTPEASDRLHAVVGRDFRADQSALDALADMLAASRHLEDETSAAHVLGDQQPARRAAADSLAAMPETLAYEAVNAWVRSQTGRMGALDAHYIGCLERGTIRWPGREYRAGLRAVLGCCCVPC